MKIHILYNFQLGSWGGGNQFFEGFEIYDFEVEYIDELH